MDLAVDASVLVAELLRVRGVRSISHPDLTLYVSEQAWSEVRHELPRRIGAGLRYGRFAPDEADGVLQAALDLVHRFVAVMPDATYGHERLRAVRWVPRDERDWPTVALALALGVGIWTADTDFLGCGVPTWTTETLLLHIDV